MAMDRDRLLRLVLTYRGMLQGYILAIVRDFHLAEDVFQDASLIILKKGQQLKEESEFEPWARKVARLEALNALRKRNKVPDLLDPALLDLLEPHWSREADPAPTLLALRECIEELSPKARRLIELRFVAGLSGATLAERLKQPVNTIYVALSRIYRNLSNCVKNRLALEE